MASLPALCLTGASGFVGRHLVGRLARSGTSDVTLLVRDDKSLPPGLPASWRVVRADLAREPISPWVLPRSSVVIHLAAATGSVDARLMRRVNVEGTGRLLRAARATGARHFIFVSSVAAGYMDQRWTPYATSKAAAERLVAESGLPHTLVRPTMVFGPGSPNQAALERLATLALPVLPGHGHVRVQPIHVEDLVSVLLQLAANPPALSGVLTVGGPSVLTMRELFAAMRQARALRPARPLALPLGVLRRSLATLSWLTRGRFPISAGQFAAFANDATAESAPNSAGLRLQPPSITLPAMLESRAGHA